MIAFLFSPLGKLVGGIAIIALCFAAFMGWLAHHDHGIREAMVKSFEQQAAEAQAKEAQRQAAAAGQAVEEYRKRLIAAQAQDKQASDQLKAITSLIASKQASSCKLTPHDIEILRGSKL
jgi:FtsZ-interacting cell division protein ZipA